MRTKAFEVDEMINYMRNDRLKAAGVKLSYTKEQLEEYYKCAQDVNYFIDNYVKIVTTDHGLVSFKMYDFQKKMIQSFIDHRFTIAKIGRQFGKSTVTTSYILWQVLFHPQQHVAILANRSATAREILKKIQDSYENVPLWMQQGIKAWNKGSIELENGSRIVAESTSADSVRGKSFTLLYLDEFAIVPNTIAEEFMTAVYPTISSGTKSKIIITSTPKGMNLFYKLWTDAVAKKNLYNPIEVHWSDIPGRDNAWMEDQIKQIGQERFDQEFRTEFKGSSNTLISTAKLSALPWSDPFFEKDGFCVFNDPEPGHSYCMTVDTAKGQNLDYSAFSVFDVSEIPYKQVARYANKQISPMLYPNVIHNVAQKYNKAWVLIEIDGSGGQVGDILTQDLEYEHIFGTVTRGRGGQAITLGQQMNGKIGFKATHPMQSTGCANLKLLLESDKLIIKDFNTISELGTFVVSGKGYEAEEGRNDDIVDTLVMFGWLTMQPCFKEITSLNIQRHLFESKQAQSEESILPYGGIQVYDPDELETFQDAQGTIWEIMDENFLKEAQWWSDVEYTGDE